MLTSTPVSILLSDPPYQSLLQLLKSSRNIYDVVAACYHVIMQFQRGQDVSFVSNAEIWLNSLSDICAKKFLNFRNSVCVLINKLHGDVHDDMFEFTDFVAGLIHAISQLDFPDESEDVAYVSYYAFYIIEMIDMNLENNIFDNSFAFPNYGPLNKNTEAVECFVYFHENSSFLTKFYQEGKACFRRPLRSFKLGSMFCKVLMFEYADFDTSIPKIVPVGISEECRLQLEKEHRIRIASIPFIGYKTFDFCKVGETMPCEDDLSGAFYIKYRDDAESVNTQSIIKLLDLAIDHKSNIIVFPEFVMSPSMLAGIQNHLADKIEKNCLILVIAGTNFEYNGDCIGNNVSHIFNSSGLLLGKYYKKSPFLERYDDMIHGALYGWIDQNDFGNIKGQPYSLTTDRSKSVSFDDRCEQRGYLRLWELLSNPGVECTLIDVEGIGRILPAICRDVIDGDYTDTLAKLFMPSLLLIPAWSKSVTSFRSRLSGFAETIHTTSLLCNCCNAVKNSRLIGEFIYPAKQGSEMIAKTSQVEQAANCLNNCAEKGGCVHLIDLDTSNEELNVNMTRLFADGTILV